MRIGKRTAGYLGEILAVTNSLSKIGLVNTQVINLLFQVLNSNISSFLIIIIIIIINYLFFNYLFYTLYSKPTRQQIIDIFEPCFQNNANPNFSFGFDLSANDLVRLSF